MVVMQKQTPEEEQQRSASTLVPTIISSVRAAFYSAYDSLQRLSGNVPEFTPTAMAAGKAAERGERRDRILANFEGKEGVARSIMDATQRLI